MRAILALALCLNLSAQTLAPVAVERPLTPVLRWYQGTEVPPVRLSNSRRLRDLIRDGKLPLTVQEAIALAVENNLGLEVNRYDPLIAHWQYERSLGGGPLRGVPSGSAQIGQVASGQGISGSQASAGLSAGDSGGGGGGTGGASIAQIGPVTANLDPVLQSAAAFSHTTHPQVNTLQSQTTSLIQSTHIYDNNVTQGLLSGGFIRASFRESYLKENTPTDILNPSVAPRVYLYLQHNLLSGFGPRVNSRFIRVARKNVNGSMETFRSQLLDMVANVLNLYWGLVSSIESLKAAQGALDLAQRFAEDTQKQIVIGAMSQVDIYAAKAELGTRQLQLGVAQAAVRQQQNLLKNAISRNGLADPELDAAEIVPLDRIEVPPVEEIPPLRDLVSRALANRPDVAVTNLRLEDAEISAIGTASGVLPTLVSLLQTYNSGLAGTPQPYRGVGPNPYFVGGLGTAMGQVFRRNFPNQRGAVYFEGDIGNRIRQGDYGIDQLQLRQTQLRTRRDMNQIVVDISNQIVALRQARARHSTAVESRSIQQELLEKTQRKFQLGIATSKDVITAQRSLVAAQGSEIAALTAYARARIGLDQIAGDTLEKNHVSVEDALEGRVR